MHPKVEKYQSQLATLISFAEGRLDGHVLEVALATEEMKTLLSIFEDTRYPATTNHFRRLHNQQNRTTLGGLVNSEGIIEDFLQKANVDFRPAKRFYNASMLLLKVLPDYLDPPTEFLEKLIPPDSSLSDAQKQKLVKERLKEYFRHMGKPPKWIQNPDWPIRADQPLVFVGQLPIDMPDLFHDGGAVYVFLDSLNGSFVTVAQYY